MVMRNFVMAMILVVYGLYWYKWRYKLFIDRDRHTLHTYSAMKKIDIKVRQLAVQLLRDDVFKNDQLV